MNNYTVIVEDNLGVYIPQVFVAEYLIGGTEEERKKWKGIGDLSKGALHVLLRGPDSEDYWECWEEVLEKISYTDCGKRYVLLQDMDLFIEEVE